MSRARSTARLLLIAAAVAGCGADRRIAEGDEPIAALQVGRTSERYSTAFWQEQAGNRSAVWSVAVQFCGSEGRDLTRYPNCGAVRAAGGASSTK